MEAVAGRGLYDYDYYTATHTPHAPSFMVDHPHLRPHQHQSFLSALARRQPDPKEYPNYPDVDIRDAGEAYLIEVEVPGIKDVEAINLHWTSSRDFVLSGETKRPAIGEKAEAAGAQPYLLVGERRIGYFRRIFHLPIEAEMEKVSAKLEAGLLSIRVPKKGHVAPKGDGKIKIEGGI